jgi:type I restriction enzyme M protein
MVEPTVSQRDLERVMDRAANALRGPVDAADFKTYVFPILFLKWISDTWDLNHEIALSEWGEDLDSEIEADYHRFALPEGCHWRDVRKAPPGKLGTTIQRVLDRIEQANPDRLAGIFGDAAWGNKERLPEANLRQLIDAFSTVKLNPKVVPNDALGGAYEYMLRQFAEDSGTKAGEFFTPRAVVRMIVKVLDPKPGETIYDPACGSGGLLVETIGEVAEAGGETRSLKLYGQEQNLTTAAIARMNLFLHDIEDFKIVRGDTLRDPKHRTSGGNLRTFDVTVANPPYGENDWGAEDWRTDSRAIVAVPPAKKPEFAWVQHMIASMSPGTGRVGVVMPHGVLFRGKTEGQIREGLLERDLLEAVIGLPPNLFYNTAIPACVLVFRRHKNPDRKGRVLFVDGAANFVKATKRNELRPSDVEAIVAAYRTGVQQGSVVTRLVELDEIEKNGWSLNIGTYITGVQDAEHDAEAALAALEEAFEDLDSARDHLRTRLKAAGYA